MASGLELPAGERRGGAAHAATAGLGGLGAALPARSVPNAEVAGAMGVDDEWIVRRTGIRERRWAGADEPLTALAARAGRAALADAGLPAAALDAVLVATCSSESALPNAAPVVAHELGADRAGAFDVGSACTGFLAALSAGAGLVESGRARHVLVLGAEMLGRMLDRTDRYTAALFGDGAGAAVISAGGPGRIGATVLGADATGASLIRTEPVTGVVRMDGHETFRHAVNRLSEVTLAACEAEGVELADIDVFVFHQANRRILIAVGERLGLPAERVVDAIAGVGNTSAASIPLALSHAREQGLLHPGARVLLAAFGAGLTWGAAVLDWDLT